MRRLITGLCAALVTFMAVVPLAASASNPTTLVLNDTFGRTTIPTSPIVSAPNSDFGVGNGWMDIGGGVWNLNGSQLHEDVNNGYLTTALAQDPLLTPTPNQRIVLTTPAFTSGEANASYVPCAVVRVQPNADSYLACFTGTGAATLYTRVGTTNTSLGTATLTLTTGDQLQIDLQATGDGATTSTITANFYDASTSTLLGTISVTSTVAEFQSGGRVGASSAGTTSYPVNYTKAQIYSDTAYTATNKHIGCIGDSIMYGQHSTQGPPCEVAIRLLNQRQSLVHYIPENFGAPGSLSGTWISNFETDAVADCNAVGGCGTYIVMLGTNDSRNLPATTNATYLSNMQSIVNYIASNASPANPNIIVEGPPWLDYVRFNGSNYTSASVSNLQGFIAQFPSLTGVTIGDTTAISLFQGLDFTSLYDGVHPNDLGVPVLATLWANSIYPISGSPFGLPFFRGVN